MSKKSTHVKPWLEGLGYFSPLCVQNPRKASWVVVDILETFSSVKIRQFIKIKVPPYSSMRAVGVLFLHTMRDIEAFGIFQMIFFKQICNVFSQISLSNQTPVHGFFLIFIQRFPPPVSLVATGGSVLKFGEPSFFQVSFMICTMLLF